MASSPGRRKQCQDPPSGSRFTGLELDCENVYPSLNNQRKRRATKSENIQTSSFFNKSMRMIDLMDGPKFIVMKRNDDDESLTLRTVNPFLIQKSISNYAGAVKSIARTRQGTILIETVSKQQAEKFYKMASLSNQFNVVVFEHPNLNTSRGVVSCQDFLFMTDEEILEGLKDQHVVGIKRFTRRPSGSTDSTARVNTPSAILTFNLPHYPAKINIAFQSCDVRPFVPQPLRCFNCQRFGHGSFRCKSQLSCGNCCSRDADHDMKNCKDTPLCANCNEQHPSWSRNCSHYKKEFEIQRIKTVERVTYIEARKMFTTRFPLNNPTSTLANIVASVPSQPNQHNNHKKQTQSQVSTINMPVVQHKVQQTKSNQSFSNQPQVTSSHNNTETSNEQIKVTINAIDIHNDQSRSRSNTRSHDQQSQQEPQSVNQFSIQTRSRSNTRKSDSKISSQSELNNSSLDDISDFI